MISVLLNTLVTTEVDESGAMSSISLENFAVSEIIKSYQNVGKTPYIHYYRG